jgi:hypothetical protein
MGRPPEQLHRLADGGVRRNAVKVAQLVDAKVEREAYGFSKRGRIATSEVADEVVELRTPAETALHQFRGQGCVSRLKADGKAVEQIRREGAVVGVAENAKRDASSGG